MEITVANDELLIAKPRVFESSHIMRERVNTEEGPERATRDGQVDLLRRNRTFLNRKALLKPECSVQCK